jgi:hypothetical protein
MGWWDGMGREMALLAVFLMFLYDDFLRDLLVSLQGQSDWPRGRYFWPGSLLSFTNIV